MQKNKPIQVALVIHSSDNRMNELKSAIARQQDIELREIADFLSDIWMRIVSMSPDILLFCCDRYGDAEKEAIGLVLRSTSTRIIVALAGHLARSEASESERLEIITLPAAGCVINYREIAEKIRKHHQIKLQQVSGEAEAKPFSISSLPYGVLNTHVIAIGASTGGTVALTTLFKLLPAHIPGIVVVQHMPPVFTRMYAEGLRSQVELDAVEAGNGEQIKPGTVYIAPGDRHLMIKRVGTSYYTVLGGTEKLGGHCPAVNVLFDSVADQAGRNSTGIILTGMGADGASGLLAMRRSGAYTIGQDEKSSTVYGMPKEAYDIGAVITQAPLIEIPRILMSHLSKL